METFREWTESRKLRCEIPPPKKIDSVNNLCATDLGKCLPPQVLEYHGKNPKVDGPNCWNLALVMAGVLPSLRYSHDNEMAFFMNSPLCRKLGADEPKKPGDIGAIRGAHLGAEVHGFMWVSDQIVYSKNGSSKDNPYALQGYKNMRTIYKDLMQEECKKNPNQECHTKVETLRCDSMEKYLEDPKRMMPKKIREAFIRLDHADRCMTIHHFMPGGFNFQLKKNLVDNINVLSALFDSPEFKESVNKLPQDEKNFIVGTFSLRLESMHRQMGLSSQSLAPCLTCYLLSRQITRASNKLPPLEKYD